MMAGNSNIRAQFIDGVRHESDGSVWTTRKTVCLSLPDVPDSTFITTPCLPYINALVPAKTVTFLAGDVEIERISMKEQRLFRVSTISVKPLGEVTNFLHGKINRAFQRLNAVKHTYSEMVADGNLMSKLGKLAQYRLLQLSKIDDNEILFYEKDINS